MLGFRGCRLAIRYPEITEMQARAIFEAAVSAARKTGKPVVPEVMIPLVAYRREFDMLRDVIVETADAVREGDRRQARLPDRHHDRAAARGAQGRRDRRRRDGRRVLLLRHQRPDADLPRAVARRRRRRSSPTTRERAIFEVDPVRVDRSRRRRRAGAHRHRARPHGAARTSRSASAASMAAIRPRSPSATQTGLDYVSCSPFRVPVARLAAAQAAIRAKT